MKKFVERRTPAADLDCRILKVRRDAMGNRRREWRDIPEACSAATFNDFPLPGERTAAWCIAHVDRHHGGMEQHHALFKTLCKLQMSDWGIELHETLAGIIHTAACYDQLDLTKLACGMGGNDSEIHAVHRLRLPGAHDREGGLGGGQPPHARGALGLHGRGPAGPAAHCVPDPLGARQEGGGEDRRLAEGAQDRKGGKK